MKFAKLLWTSALILMAAALTSCNLGKAPERTADVNAIYTSAAQTMVAGLRSQQTQTAQALPPTATLTPLATFTPLPTFPISTGSVPFGTPGTPLVFATVAGATLPSGTGVYSFPQGCNDATFIGETAPYDGTVIGGGKLFDKGFSMLNSGTCKWDEGYSFAFKSGDQMQAQNVVLTKQSAASDFTTPGHSQAFVLHMQAPRAPGEYKGFWQMKSDAGVWFGSIVYVDIVVLGKGTVTATATNHH
jgi:hypothetical protein